MVEPLLNEVRAELKQGLHAAPLVADLEGYGAAVLGRLAHLQVVQGPYQQEQVAPQDVHGVPLRFVLPHLQQVEVDLVHQGHHLCQPQALQDVLLLQMIGALVNPRVGCQELHDLYLILDGCCRLHKLMNDDFECLCI